MKKDQYVKKKILFVASECQPYAASGGLGEVIGSLPKALAKDKNYDVRVVLPLYGIITAKYREKMTYIGNTVISLSWRNQYAGVFELKENGITYYFIDNEYYFKRSGLYGYLDEAERYAFFSRAALEILPMINFIPQVIHCHDWQTALIPVYLKTNYALRDTYKHIRSVFTIHNMEYQGRYSMELLYDLFELPEWAASIVEYQGDINLMKGAIQTCDIVSTVSPSYAKEILEPGASCGLHYINKKNEYKMYGILNGIDTEGYNSMLDKQIFVNFDENSLEKKAENKKLLQELVGLKGDETVPVIGIISRLVAHKGFDLVKFMLEELLQRNVNVVILGTGEHDFEEFFVEMALKYPNKCKALIEYNGALSRKIYAGSDIFLMPSKTEPCGLAQMICSRYGTIPVVRKIGGLGDSIDDYGAGDGNGFTFQLYNAHHMLDSLDRALKLYENKEKWQELQKRVMLKDFSWEKSAVDYKAMYDKLLSDK